MLRLPFERNRAGDVDQGLMPTDFIAHNTHVTHKAPETICSEISRSAHEPLLQ